MDKLFDIAREMEKAKNNVLMFNHVVAELQRMRRKNKTIADQMLVQMVFEKNNVTTAWMDVMYEYWKQHINDQIRSVGE